MSGKVIHAEVAGHGARERCSRKKRLRAYARGMCVRVQHMRTWRVRRGSGQRRVRYTNVRVRGEKAVVQVRTSSGARKETSMR